LALLTPTTLNLEDGSEEPYADWDTLAALLARTRAVALCVSVVDAGPLPAAVCDPHAAVLVTQRNGIGGVRVRRGRTTGWLVNAASWGVPATLDGLRRVRALADHTGEGVYPTPSSLGLALMRRTYPARAAKLPRPPWQAWEQLHTTLVGGRVDTLIAPEREVAWLWELDQNAAYIAAARRVPGGTTRGFSGALPSWAAVGYQFARVRYHTAPPLGPLPVRVGGAVIYPRSPGELVTGWYWTEELAAAAPYATIERGDGIAWPAWAETLAPWAERVWTLRGQATPELAGMVKALSVAALGRLAVDRTTRRLVGERPARGFPYCDPHAGMGAGYWIAEAEGEREAMLLHVNSYVMAATRLALWRKACVYAARGLLVATNYDAVYQTDRREPLSSGDLGAWKARKLHHVRIRAPRWIESDEKTRTPGQRRVS
jgi:hypothetical protein